MPYMSYMIDDPSDRGIIVDYTPGPDDADPFVDPSNPHVYTPGPDDADPFVDPSNPHVGGMNLTMGDGSVRSLTSGVSTYNPYITVDYVDVL
jgi:prepilin-type processing-associated H-X9-DG protein